MKRLCSNRRAGFWFAIAVAIVAASSVNRPAHAQPAAHAVLIAPLR